jgi:hypothetical protein
VSAPPTRGALFARRLWTTTRHDIGRKLTALVMATALWLVLQNLVIASQPLELPVKAVATQADADQERATTPGIYLIVPDELIVRSVSEPRVHLTVSGLRDEVEGLSMSTRLLFTVADLGGADEITLSRPLERGAFDPPAGQVKPHLTSFRVRPEVLEVTLARRDTAEVSLTAENVVTAGPPKPGYLFRNSRITLQPVTVSLSGPARVIEPLLQDPSRVKLEPIDIAGKSWTVSDWVGLAQELRDQGVTLQPGGNGQVLVTVPIEAEPIVRDLFAVPIEYRNEDKLQLRRQKASNFQKSLDIKVVGPPSELDNLTDGDLLAKIVLLYDWSLASSSFVGETTGDVVAYMNGLPETVHVTDSKGNEKLKIEYTMELNPLGAADGK